MNPVADSAVKIFAIYTFAMETGPELYGFLKGGVEFSRAAYFHQRRWP